jgi:hypothetical protein
MAVASLTGTPRRMPAEPVKVKVKVSFAVKPVGLDR